MFHIKDNRREFFKKIMIAGVTLVFGPDSFADTNDTNVRKHSQKTSCDLFRALNGTPDRNLAKVVEMMGGIEKLIGPDDVVMIKPNAQWWNQGSPNLSALKKFVDLIMERKGGFHGEVVIAENVHRGKTPWTSMKSGWAQSFEWNSNIPGIKNLHALGGLLKEKYGSRFSLVHWVDVDAGNKRIFSPADGDGYVFCDGTGGVPLIVCDNGAKGKKYRATIMTYPVFSTDRGTRIDFKNGIWEKGKYTGQPLRFINFAALNHHSTYCGATSSFKNYLGVTDLSGGPDPYNKGRLTEKYYNFHSFPLDKWAPGPEPGMLGKEVGIFTKFIRKADFNITTAEWVGLTSRVDPPLAHTRTILACMDPIALDYHSTKYVLYPNSKASIHNPDNRKCSLYYDLLKCAKTGDFIFDEEKVQVVSYDFEAEALQKDDKLVILGDKKWGSNFKQILKYFVLRYYYSTYLLFK